jgi:iron complex outermembrane recepter protein
MTPKKRISLVSLFALAMALPALAQTPQAPSAPQAEPQATPQAEPQDQARDVVVVTANKREETVQDIPVAVTAITSTAKQELGIITVTDLTNVTPGLSYTPGNERVTLRGIGRLTNSFGADPGVANYNDGLYTAFAVFAGKDPMLIERVEVLRGPQGTLYGRNAIGGAINTISKRPTDDFHADAVLGFGNFGALKAGVAVSGPINDWLRYRVAGFREFRDGIDHNYGQGDEVGWEINDSYLEGQLEGNIGDRFTWWLKVAELTYDKAGPPGGRTATFSTAPYLVNTPSAQFVVPGGLTPNAAFGFTSSPSVLAVTQEGGRRDNPFSTSREHAYNTNLENTAHLPAYDEVILEAVYSTDWFDIKYTGGYTYYDYVLDSDPDGTPITSVTYNAITSVSTNPACGGGTALPQTVLGFPTSTFPSTVPAGVCYTFAPRTIRPNTLNRYKESRSFFSNEINLISTTDGPLQWIVGLYQYQENSKQPGQAQYLTDEPLANFYLDTVLGVVANPDRTLQYFSNTSLFNAYGVYGQADYSFNDQWKATLGLRWSEDVKESKEEGFLACYIICGVNYFNFTRTQFGAIPGTTFDSKGFANRRLEGSWDAVTGTAGIEYRPLNDTLLFAKYSRGYKSGGFNNLGFNALPYTDPEFVDSYEGGWKQDWNDWNLTTNSALFFYNYTDVQAPLTVVVTDPTTGIQSASTRFVNLPEVQSAGFELEANWNPIEPLNIGITYAYLKTDITESDSYADASRDPRCNNPIAGQPPVTCSAAATTLVDPLRNRSVEGNQLAQSPEHKFAINATYRIDFEDGSYLLPTVSYSWRDEFYDTFFNNDNEKSPAYDNLDARLNWYSSGGRFSVTAWVRNALDEEQTTSIAANTFRNADLSRYQTYSYAPPRTYGIDLLFHY